MKAQDDNDNTAGMTDREQGCGKSAGSPSALAARLGLSGRLSCRRPSSSST